MEQPGRLFTLFKNTKTSNKDTSSITGETMVDDVLCSLEGSDLTTLLRYVRDWNTSRKSSDVAQSVLHAIVKNKTAEDLMKAFDDEAAEKGFLASSANDRGGNSRPAFKEIVDALLAYTERHLSKMDKLVQDSYTLDYVLSEMDDSMIAYDTEMDVDMEDLHA